MTRPVPRARLEWLAGDWTLVMRAWLPALSDGDWTEITGPAPPLCSGNTCYHAGMAKTQLGARVDEDVAELAKKRAADLGLSIGDYLARLVQDDASGLRARAVDTAARFLAEHQAIFDEAEQAQQTPKGARAA